MDIIWIFYYYVKKNHVKLVNKKLITNIIKRYQQEITLLSKYI